MPPKAPRAGRGAADAAATATATGTSLHDSTKVFSRMEENMLIIKRHPVFKKIVEAAPLSISRGGHEEPFSSDSYHPSLKQTGMYSCSVNLMWLDFKYLAMPGIPIQARAIEEARLQYFRTPSLYPKVIVISSPSDRFNPMEHKGALERVTPAELTYAMVEAIRLDVDAGREDCLKAWRNMILTVSGRFQVFRTFEEKWWFEHNCREDMASDCQTMTRTTYQRICEVLRFRQHLSTTEGPSQATPKAMAARYAEKARTSSVSEVVTESFLMQALAINDKLFSLPTCLQCIRHLEELLGHENPLNGISKLTAILRGARREELEWVILSLHDHILSDVFKHTSLSCRELESVRGGKNLVGVYVLRKRFLAFAFSKAEVQWPASYVSVLRSVFQCHDSYRRQVCPRPREPPVAKPDLSYAASWPESIRLFAKFLEDTVYKHEQPFLGAFINAAKAGKGVEDVLAYQCFDEAWKTIMRALEDEKTHAAAVGGDAPTLTEAIVIDEAEPSGSRRSSAGGTSNADDDGNTNGGYWMSYAQQLLESRVHLQAVAKEERVLAQEIEKSAVFKVILAAGTSNRMVVYDTKLASEANSRPGSRKAPARDVYLKSALVAARRALSKSSQTVTAGDIYAIFDHNKKRPADFHQHFKKSAEEKLLATDVIPRRWVIITDFASVLKRKRLRRVEQMETLHVYTANSEEVIPDRSFGDYPGSTRGEVIPNVVLRPYSEVWRVSKEDKKAAYGDAVIPVGGAAADPDDVVTDEIEDEWEGQDKVPFTFWSYPKELGMALIHAFRVSSIVDFTPGDGSLAMAAMESKCQYMGFCFTEKHVLLLKQHLVKCVLASLQTEGNALYSAACAKQGQVSRDDDGPRRRSPAQKKSPKRKKREPSASESDGAASKTEKKKKKHHKKETKKAKSAATSSSSSPPP